MALIEALGRGIQRWLYALLLAGLATPALAAITVTNITVNGQSSATVAPGATITVSVTVVLTNGTRWRSTAFSTSPASSLVGCSLSPDISLNGTHTVNFQVPAPSANNTYALNIAAWTNPNCNGSASPTRSLPGAINTGPATLTLHHVRIVHDGAALVCSPEAVTLRACANAACTSAFTDNVNVTLGNVGTWSANPVTIANGSGTVTLASGSAGTVTLAGTVTSPSATNTALQCYRGSTAGACALVFSNGSCSLDAVEPGRAPNTPIFTKRIGGTLTLDVLALNSGVVNTTSTATVSAQLVAAEGSGCSTTPLSASQSFTYTGANAGKRTLTFIPTKAARDVRVRMTSGSLVQCSSDNFAIRPSDLSVGVTGAVLDTNGTNPNIGTVLKAGSATFRFSATAFDGYNGTPLVDAAMAAAPGGFNTGSLAATDAIAPALPSVANNFTYSEVGFFRLQPYGLYDDGDFTDVDGAKPVPECFTDANLGSGSAPGNPNVADGSGKLGCYFGNTAASEYVGRFIPDHFALSVGGVVNRSAIAACSAATFSYIGEQMTPVFTLTAQNKNDETTVNYTGTFAKLKIPTQLGLAAINDPMAPAVRTPFPACTATPSHPCFTPATPSGTFSAGEAPAISAPLTLHRAATRSGPFEVFKIGVAPVDDDGVKLLTYDVDTTNVAAGTPDHKLVAPTIVRYGRLNVDNTYGSELLNMTVKASAQYWNGVGYSTNLLDSCTPMAALDFQMDSYVGGITSTNMPMSKLSSAGPLLAGVGKLMLARPGPAAPASRGSVVVSSKYPYLPGSGRATFGVYKSGPVIYVRETY